MWGGEGSVATIRVRQRHLYTPDPAVPADVQDNQPCLCGLPKANERHRLPDAPRAAKERDAAVLGERS